MQEAVKKLQTEIFSSNNNPYVKVIGEFLIGHIQANPSEASKVLDAEKTIAKSLSAMQAEARQKAVNGIAMLTDAEGFAIVLKYFEIDGQAIAGSPVVETVSAKAESFSLSLDDLLGGR